MATPEALIKDNPLLPAQDFTALRKKGFKDIEKLGSTVWTDYNNSDPGITMLDAVCYAITDLAYRTDFEIKDLLAPEQFEPDTWDQIFYTARKIFHNGALTINDYRKLIIDIAGVRNAWITPSKDYEVPLWINYNHFEHTVADDCTCNEKAPKICFGRLQLDRSSEEAIKANAAETVAKITEQIQDLLEKNAALQEQINALSTPNEDGEPAENHSPKEIEATTAKLREQIQQNLRAIERLNRNIQWVEHFPYLDSKIVELEGLYNVMVEYEEDIINDEQRDKVRSNVQERLYHHRNLGEDFLSVNAVEYEDVGLSASIALEEDADPDTVLAHIYFTIYKYFTPSVPFYTIDQLLEKGLQIDEIFEGPALKHGFIDSQELEATALYRDIRLSDIINEVSDIPGIQAITFFQMPFSGFENHDFNSQYFNAWVKRLQNEQKIARIQPELSSVLFCKQREFISYNTKTSTDRRPERMLKLFKDLKVLERRYKLKGTARDLPVPIGEYMNLEDYYPVTETLPMCYGISQRAGLPATADEQRKKQALQLRGYLLFFEQLLADYLVQLNHLKELFSFDPSVNSTYFTKALTQIYGLQDLLIDHNEHGANHWDKILNDFTHVLEHLIETPEEFFVRRNTFLNHLLARFAEDLTEYENIMKWLTPYEVEKRLVRDKVNLLAHGEYYKISSNRGKGYNYASPEYWETDNVSGTERRVGRLLGFCDVKRRSLVPNFICIEPALESDGKTTRGTQKVNNKGKALNLIRFIDPETKSTLMTSIEVAEGCCTTKLLEEILKYIDQKDFFKFNDNLKQRARKSAGTIGKFSFELWDATDPETAILLATSEQYSKRADRQEAFDRLQALVWEMNNNEGFHLVEHLLLRPKFDEVFDENGESIPVALLDTCLDACDLGKGLDEGTERPKYRKKIFRIPAARCFDKMPWVLEYLRYNAHTQTYDQSLLFQEVNAGTNETNPLKFRKYEKLIERIQDIQEFGAERNNYEIVQTVDGSTGVVKYGFIIRGSGGQQLAQSPYIFDNKADSTTGINDLEMEFASLMREFGYELDLYCEENPCDNNEDPYSFRATAVFPCWPKRFRDPTFKGLVERTLEKEAPAHMHIQVHWVSIAEMTRFEEVYCNWLAEMHETEIPSYDIVNPLVEVINTLAPCGCDDCEDDCNDMT